MNEPDINDPKFWKWSVFYYNPKDEHLFVPRPDGLGLSFNFAHKTPYIIIGGILILVLALVLYNLDILKF
jgi:uncharacterized membrane protein